MRTADEREGTCGTSQLFVATKHQRQINKFIQERIVGSNIEGLVQNQAPLGWPPLEMVSLLAVLQWYRALHGKGNEHGERITW